MDYPVMVLHTNHPILEHIVYSFSAMLYHPQLDDSLANHPKLDTLTNHPFLEFDLTSLSLHTSMYRKSTTSRA